MKIKLRRIELVGFETCKIYTVEVTAGADIIDLDFWHEATSEMKCDLVVLEKYTDPMYKVKRKIVVMKSGCQLEMDDNLSVPKLVKRNSIERGVDKYYLFEIL